MAGRLQLSRGRDGAQRTPQPTPLARVTVERYLHRVSMCRAQRNMTCDATCVRVVRGAAVAILHALVRGDAALFMYAWHTRVGPKLQLLDSAAWRRATLPLRGRPEAKTLRLHRTAAAETVPPLCTACTKRSVGKSGPCWPLAQPDSMKPCRRFCLHVAQPPSQQSRQGHLYTIVSTAMCHCSSKRPRPR